MSIELHCDHCGQKIRAPAEAGGRWGDCPQCGQKVYIPTPAEDLEEIPLAPVDEEEERRARRQREADMAFEVELQQGGPAHDGSAGGRPPAEPDPSADASNLTGQLVKYVRGMGDGRMAECDGIVAGLVGRRREVEKAIKQLTAQTPLPGALAAMPPAVVKGYLKQLLGQL